MLRLLYKWLTIEHFAENFDQRLPVCPESLSARLDESRRIINELTKQLSETGKEGLAQLERLERFLLRQAAEGRDLENVGSKRELERTKALAQQRFLDIQRLECQLMDYQKLLRDHGIEDPY